MTYKQLIEVLELPVSRATLQKALARRGYHRHEALPKPPTSERTRQRRPAFTKEHGKRTGESNAALPEPPGAGRDVPVQLQGESNAAVPELPGARQDVPVELQGETP